MSRRSRCAGWGRPWTATRRIYGHAADKYALLDSVVEHVLSELVVTGESDRDGNGGEHGGDWETALRRTAHAFRRIALAHPNAVPLLVTRSVTTVLAT